MINHSITGGIEEYGASIGFRNDTRPKENVLAMWMSFGKEGFEMSEYVLDRPDMKVQFPLSVFKGTIGKEKGKSGMMVSMTEKVSDIVFKRSNHVSDWTLIEDRFRTSLDTDEASKIDWSKGNKAYVRWKVSAHPTNYNTGALVVCHFCD